jgi:Flp pilus assembly pilin Flp
MKSWEEPGGMPAMTRFTRTFRFFVYSSRASTAIEYTLIAAGVALAIVTVVFALGDTVFADLYDGLAEAISQ